MVSVNYCVNQIGTVAVFATLFVAISVNGEKGCVLNFQHGDADFDFKCNEGKKFWAIKDVEKEPEDTEKKALTLQPQEEGCLTTKDTVSLNSGSTVACRLYQGGDENESLTMILQPKEGKPCPEEQCVWNISKEPQLKTKKWVTLEHKFPLQSANDFHIQFQVGKTKGNFYLDNISVPSDALAKCHKSGRSANVSNKENLKELEDESEDTPFQLAAGSNTTEKSLAPGLVDLRKNLMLTSASVLTLNHLLN